MKKVDLIYTNLISLLDNLTDTSTVSFDNYYNSINNIKQDTLVDKIEAISKEKKAISSSHSNTIFHSDFTPLIKLINEFESSFGNFSNFRFEEIYAIINIIEKINLEYSSVPNLNLNEKINPNNFSVIDLSENINQNNFFFFDSSNILDSLFLFNFKEKDAFKDYIASISQGSAILFYLLEKIGNRHNQLQSEKNILVRKKYRKNPKKVWATLCLHIIKSGEIIHNFSEYTLPPKILQNCNVTLGKNYQQFIDSIGIISEYNFHKDILDKYLRIYHVLENFMYKSPLVSLEKNSAGQVFSIRDFKRMYDKINDSELSMLKKLFETILKINLSQGNALESKILSELTFIINHNIIEEQKFNHLIKILNINKSNFESFKFNDINLNGLSSFLSKMIYAFRNSMVHNRETEFHLTHSTLINHLIINDTAKIFLEKFLLPMLEEIVFYLIINENDIVWYDKSVLKLWNEE